MKKNIWYLFLLVFLLAGCEDSKDEDTEYEKIEILTHYPFVQEKRAIDDVDDDILEVFQNNVFSINSSEQLGENHLFSFFTDDIKEKLSKCDFHKYTLIIAATSGLNEITDLKSLFLYNTFTEKYEYKQTLYCMRVEEPIEDIYLITNAFLISKISEDSKFSYSIAYITKS